MDHTRRFRPLLVCASIASIAIGVAACFSFSDLSGGTDAGDPGDASQADAAPTGDAAATDAADAGGRPASGFLVSLAPKHVTEDPGDTAVINVTLNRASSFTDAVLVTVGGLPSGVTATPLLLDGSQSKGSFDIAFSGDAGAVGTEVSLVVTASNAAGDTSATAPLGLRLGSELTADGGTYLVPDFASGLIVKAWGAGGGGGGINGSPGGGGGFVSATIPVVPGETLNADVGTGGTDNGGGAGGGGLTGLRRGSTYLLIAGGGGGGGWSFNYPPQTPDRTGGGGGGLTGQDGPDPAGGGGHGGTQTAGGAGGPDAGAGSSLQGGNAENPNQPGGVPGGGFGGVDESDSTGGGGGGAGYFGGGAGAESSALQGTAGGGGGSGYVETAATNAVLIGAVDSNCANATDPDYVNGVGNGGPGGPESKPNGADGRLVVRLTKP